MPDAPTKLDEDAIRAAIKDAESPDPAKLLRAEVERLAKLDRADYETERRKIAQSYGIRTSALDEMVVERRKVQPGSAAPMASGRLDLSSPEPWPDPVDGAVLLDELVTTFKRFLSLPQHAPETMALWTLFAHTFEAAQISPRLLFKSPTPRCGKSRAMEVLARLVPSALSASSISVSALFRSIDAAGPLPPTLFIDEADAAFGRKAGNEDLRALLNAGHTPEQAFVVRSVPAGEKEWAPKRFSVWCPMAIATIGSLPQTVEDRSIAIPMRRRHAGEKIERARRRTLLTLAPLAQKVARWAKDNLDGLRNSDPVPPPTLDDRAADSWEPLLAIADAIGRDWQARARSAAIALSGDRDGDEQSAGVKLLADIRSIFDERKAYDGGKIDRLPSAQIAEALAGMEGRPWPEYRRGRPITPAQVARLLSPFSIAPGSIRLPDSTTPKGYMRTAFRDAWRRYLRDPPDPPDSDRHNATTPRGEGENGDFQTATDGHRGGSKNGTSAHGEKDCGGVADRTGLNDADQEFFSPDEAEIDRLARADSDDDEGDV